MAAVACADDLGGLALCGLGRSAACRAYLVRGSAPAGVRSPPLLAFCGAGAGLGLVVSLCVFWLPLLLVLCPVRLLPGCFGPRLLVLSWCAAFAVAGAASGLWCAALPLSLSPLSGSMCSGSAPAAVALPGITSTVARCAGLILPR